MTFSLITSHSYSVRVSIYFIICRNVQCSLAVPESKIFVPPLVSTSLGCRVLARGPCYCDQKWKNTAR